MKTSLQRCGFAARGLLVLAAALLLASPVLAQTMRPADQPAAQQNQPARAVKATVSGPAAPASGLRTRRSPDAGLSLAPAPRLGQIPSVAGGIPRLDAFGFAPDAPVFGALQPELPAAAPWPRRGWGKDRRRGRGQGIGQGENGPSKSCAEEDSGVTVWRGDCGG